MLFHVKSDRYNNNYNYGKNSRKSHGLYSAQVAGCIRLFILVLLTPSALAGGNSFNLQEVTPGNYVHSGIHVAVEDPGHDDIANIGFIIGDKCVAVIDTGGSLDTGKKLLQHLRGITDKPVCYVINTHVHFDHVLGNAAFREENPRFVGHEQLADAIAANREFFLEQFHADLGPEPSAETIIGPDITVSDMRTLDLGNRTLLLTAYPASHTHSDLTVFDRKTRTLWAGDLVFRERIPVLDGSLKGWIHSLEDISKKDIAFTIPGHGHPGAGWKDVAAAQINYLDVLLQDTRQAIADGQFLEEAQKTVGMSERDKWLLFDQNHSRNVSKAFTELEWE